MARAPGAAPAPVAMRGFFRWASRSFRAVVMAAFFLTFFVGSPIIALVLFPALRLVAKDDADHRRRCTYLLHRGVRFVAYSARFAGLVDHDLTARPAGVDLDAPHVMISNHPSYVDMLLVLGSFERLTCVTKGAWSRHWALGRLLRSTNYLPGPGSGRPESQDMLATMVSHVRAGHPLLVFPEGQRSMARQLRRFRRGAFEAAVRADVPIVPLFLAMDRPYLTKAVPLWRPPPRRPKYTFEWLPVVRPADFGHDARAIRDHVVSLYEARFREQLALHDAISAADQAA